MVSGQFRKVTKTGIELPERYAEGEPTWLSDRLSEDRGSDLARWYVSKIFYARFPDPSILDTQEALDRAIGEAHLEAERQIAHLYPQVELASLYVGSEIDRHKWYRYLEVDSAEEYWRDLLEAAEKTQPDAGRTREIRGMHSLVNTLQDLGVPKQTILRSGSQLSKTRKAVPVLRKIVESGLEPAEQRQKIEQVLERVIDPDFTNTQFEEWKAATFEKRTIAPANASFYLVGQGKELIVLESNGPVQTSMIEHALKDIISSMKIGDPADLVKSVVAMISPASQGIYSYGYDPATRAVQQKSGGVRLLSPHGFSDKVMQLVGAHRNILLQVEQAVYIELQRIPLLNTVEDIEKLFLCSLPSDSNDAKEVEKLLEVIVKMYQIPKDFEEYLPGRKGKIIVEKSGESTVFYLEVTI